VRDLGAGVGEEQPVRKKRKQKAESRNRTRPLMAM